MKKILYTIFCLFIGCILNAQILDPVNWNFSQKKISEDEIELQFKATIEEHWYLYSQFTGQYYHEEGPIPTSFVFKESDDFQKIDSVFEERSIEVFDPIFEMESKYFEGEATFRQKIKILNTEPFAIEGEINFMACDVTQCIFPDPKKFYFNINPNGESIDKKIFSDQGITIDEIAFTKTNYKDPLVVLNKPIVDCGNKKSQEKSLWAIFILGILGGLLALITPCVFPMIPLTVSFFTKGNKEKGIFNAVIYGFFIMSIYFFLSLPFHTMPNVDPEILNQISTNTWLNLLFFVIFIAFAISFFGYYDLTLPSKWANKVDSGSNIGGLIGIFFMALTLAIVSFSCTGPILGSLLAGTLGGDISTITFLGINFKMVAFKLTAGMTGFGLALGFPFALFALFPKLLDTLPQSGGWLNSVKVILGFLEVALAIKFFSNADMVEQWGLIKREIFFALWLIIGLLTVLYLFGKIRFPHDEKVDRISVPRFGFILLFASFTIYLIPGAFGSHLNWWNHSALSGFPPPLSYSYTYEDRKEKEGEEKIFNNYWDAIAYAKKENKPIFFDFTGWACVNCRKMEENVFTKDDIEELLNKFVICQLYVDEKVLLDSSEVVIVPTADGSTKRKELKKVGDKWSTLQAVTYLSSSQPYYVLYSPKEGLLTNPVGYTPNAKNFASWLKCGLKGFKK